MKNKIFSIICAVLFGFGAFPQSQEIEYDTIIYFPSTILECPMLFDTAATEFSSTMAAMTLSHLWVGFTLIIIPLEDYPI